ncbi:MAG: transglutaminase family protein [Deltaproteobacteria bacterium]|nr:transglutaminase family protein [Deltaproteobacteria bacterium]
MSIHVNLNHFTGYQFDRLVTLSPHLVRLRPAPHCRTPIEAYSLRITPEPYFINWQQDPFGNHVARLVFPERTAEMSVEVDLIADLTVINPFDFFVEDAAQHFPFRYDEQLAIDLAPYLEVKERGPALSRWLAAVDRTPRNTVNFLVELNQRLQQDIGYVIRFEPGVQTCEQTLELARGSCRDTGWLLVQILRHLGFAARFVSGYLVQLTADVKALDGPSGPTADFTDLHAWAEVFVPGAGWLGLDPTSGLFAGEGHIPLACTPDPVTAAAITGYTDECESTLTYRNTVTRIREDPRVTKPYTEEQWAAIDALGAQVDADLVAGDVRLTMGGEPTFVSIDDMEGAEWTVAALGPAKRLRAGALLRALQARFAAGGVLHYGQGKWYPGEPLPRWALSCFWRTDGAALWNDRALLADEAQAGGVGLAEAQRFIELLAATLGLAPDLAVPGYEDVFYYLWKEGTLPVNVDPLQTNLDDPEERQRLATLLRRGLGTVTGYALPLRWDDSTWVSSRWTFRRARMYLIPGASPMGYRLPLDSLPWAAPIDLVDNLLPLDPWASRPPLREPRVPLMQQADTGSAGVPPTHRDASISGGDPAGRTGAASPDASARAAGETPTAASLTLATDAAGLARTALCVEPRDGHLYVFLPPLPMLEAYIDLLAALEGTAAALGIPIVLEGYEPPRDARLRKLAITPDPGVIEVNVHPSHSWDELRELTEVLYHEARQCRLGTEKFMLDGRHTGTGGGNHVTIGGATPADSAVLRRPDLLRSLLTFWQRHPSLSYLFSGMFVGPTSQAPRVDEARNDALYELEIAFQQQPGAAPPPWLVDRLLRNLLIDVTGNTHRTEFCIDKLYSPDGPTGRLGLVEMRAFEMPPHARMSLVQMLLLRAVIARCWRTPYRGDLVRWDTALHDRFMLPHFLWEDMREVICDLERHGYPFALEWFAPFLEFRFPRYGTAQVGDVSIELRQAVEPWHVLGEEVGSQGTARYVDSSVERLQVRVDGLTAGRHVVTCNGRRVPLRATGRRGEQVAGVRYRAWQPPSALHPTIPVHAPLIFDLVDTWQQRSLGGCTYHVAHPAGRNYEVFPVNANEAEARRVARFWSYGHTPGPMPAPPEERSLEYPYTLDLRRSDGCA